MPIALGGTSRLGLASAGAGKAATALPVTAALRKSLRLILIRSFLGSGLLVFLFRDQFHLAKPAHHDRCGPHCGASCNPDHAGGPGRHALTLGLIHRGKSQRWRDRLDVGQRMDRLGEPNALLGATKTRVPRAHWPTTGANIAKQDGGTIGISLRSLTAQLVQAPALAVPLVTEFHRETSRVKMRAAFAVFVDQAAVGELRPVLGIQRRQRSKSYELEYGAEEVVRIRRTWD